MTLPQFSVTIRNEYRDCCLTDSYQDAGCGINVSGFDPKTLTTINGSQNQTCHKHGRPGRLCDRLIFGRLNKVDRDFVCAAELKGGTNLDASVAIKQIQSGLNLAHSVLANQSTVTWYPLLVYSGSSKGHGLNLLRSRKVSFRGEKQLVDRINCGSNLHRYLSRPHRQQSS